MWREFISSSESRRKSWPETVQRKALEEGRDGDVQPKCRLWHSLWQAKPQSTQSYPSRTLWKNHVFKLGNNIEPGVLIHTLFFFSQGPPPPIHTGYFLGLQNHCRWWLQPWYSKIVAPWKKSYDQPRQHIKKQRHYFANKGPSSQSYGFSSSHVKMWELDHKESWAMKNWCFWTVVLEKTLESPLNCKEINPVNSKGNQPRIFIGRSDAEAETPILWLPDAKNWLIGKDPDAGKDWRQEETGMTEDEMVGWHHRFDGHEFEQTPGVGDGQGSLACCSLWGRKELDMTEWLNWLTDCAYSTALSRPYSFLKNIYLFGRAGS